MNKPKPEDHNHSHGNPFAVPFFLILAFAVIEFAGGIWTQSLALLGDAWHMFSDVFALALAWFASAQAQKNRSTKHASGQSQIEIRASIINVVLMLIVVVWIVFEALQRLKNPPNITGGYVMLIAFIGLLVNVIVAQRLHHQAHHHGGKDNLNHRAALLHVLGDLLGSIAALLAGALIYFTGWLAADPILSLFISALILVVTIKLANDIRLALKQGDGQYGVSGNSSHDHHH
ncbi:MAG: cation diffusion facilitator family transporter [Pseudomonadota bacterium]